MTIRFACRCGKKMKTSDDKIGKKVLCSACGSPVVVPASNTAAVEKVVAPIAASETAGELLRGTAARDTKKKGRNLAYDDPTLDTGSTYDATETAKYLTMSFVLPAGIVLLFCGLVYGVSTWMSKTSKNHPELAEVTGTVYLDGQPLNGAKIILTPKVDGGDPRGSASIGRTDKEGHFRMQYARDADGDPIYGVPLGECTVQIMASDSSRREISPIKYRDRSETRVIEAGSNEFEFRLDSASQ